MMTTLIVLATLIAAPLFWGPFGLAAASFMALYFGSEMDEGAALCSSNCAGFFFRRIRRPHKGPEEGFAMTYVRESFALRFCYALGELIGETASI